MALRGASPLWICLQLKLDRAKRRPQTAGLCHRRGRPLRPPGQQTDSRGDGELPEISPPGTTTAQDQACGNHTGADSFPVISQGLGRAWRKTARSFAILPPRRRMDAVRRCEADSELSSEPAEYVDRKTHSSHVSQGLSSRAISPPRLIAGKGESTGSFFPLTLRFPSGLWQNVGS